MLISRWSFNVTTEGFSGVVNPDPSSQNLGAKTPLICTIIIVSQPTAENAR